MLREVDERVRAAVQCAFDDPECIEPAEAEGQDVGLMDAEGNVVCREIAGSAAVVLLASAR